MQARRPCAADLGGHRGRRACYCTRQAELAALRQLTSNGTSVTQAARTPKMSRSTACAALAGTR